MATDEVFEVVNVVRIAGPKNNVGCACQDSLSACGSQPYGFGIHMGLSSTSTTS